MTITVASGDMAGLIAAIAELNASGGGTIQLAGGTYSASAASDWWYGPNALPAIATAIVIEGNGAILQRAAGADKMRLVFVSGGISTMPAGSLTLRNLRISGWLARGGNGGDGLGAGGGGAGMGGAIFNQGRLEAQSVVFSQNGAAGGDGGVTSDDGTGGSGGGGGIGGDGGPASSWANDVTSGGGGFKTDGKPGCVGGADNNCPDSVNLGYHGGDFLGTEGSHGFSAFGGNGGFASNDPWLPITTQGAGGGGFSPGQNGSVGIENSTDASGNDVQGSGGPGAIGGGTGGDGWGIDSGRGGAFGGGGSGSAGAGGGGGGGVGGGGGGGRAIGGGGGFGGGAGGGYGGGCGGFGGGGGGGYDDNSGGPGGFGGGNGFSGRTRGNTGGAPGGGGAGMGGAIFNHRGVASLTDVRFKANAATGGNGAGAGQGLGGAVFNLNGTVLLTRVTASGNTVSTPGSAVLYNLSHNGGIVVAGEVPETVAGLGDTTLAAGDIVNNQTDGSAIVLTAVSPGDAAVTSP